MEIITIKTSDGKYLSIGEEYEFEIKIKHNLGFDEDLEDDKILILNYKKIRLKIDQFYFNCDNFLILETETNVILFYDQIFDKYFFNWKDKYPEIYDRFINFNLNVYDISLLEKEYDFKFELRNKHLIIT